MNYYLFNESHASRYGVPEAIILSCLLFWIQKNLANGANISDGRCWTYNSARAFTVQFPFWTERQIRRILKSLESQGAIVTGHHSSDAMDRVTWYSVNPELLSADEQESLSSKCATEHSGPFDQNVKCILPECQMQFTEPSNAIDINNNININKTEKNKQIYKEPVSKDTEKKVAKKTEYAPSVFLTEAEYRKLADEVKDDIGGLLEFYSNYKVDKSYKNKSDYLSIRRWGISGFYENREKMAKARRSGPSAAESDLIRQLKEEHDRGIKKEMEEKERKRKAAEELEKRVETMSEYEKLFYEYRKLGYDQWDAKLQTDNTFIAPSRMEEAKNTPWQQSRLSFIREGFKK